MKIHIERKTKKGKEKKKPKTMHVGTHKKSVLFLWTLLIGSLTFGIYKNFTAINTHTIHETSKIEPMLVDTHAIESFTINFVQEYYNWENNKDTLEERTEKVNYYLTPQLQELNTDTIRSDIPTSSKVQSVQIWKIEPIDEENYSVVYTVEQEITEGKDTTTTTSNFKLVIHQDSEKNLIVTQNPTIWDVPTHSNYQPKESQNDINVDEETKQEITSFLETFFQLYPTASKNEIIYYVQKDALPVINKKLKFSNILNSIIEKETENYKVSVSIMYLDTITKSTIISQYQLILEKENTWKIIKCLNV